MKFFNEEILESLPKGCVTCDCTASITESLDLEDNSN